MKQRTYAVVGAAIVSMALTACGKQAAVAPTTNSSTTANSMTNTSSTAGSNQTGKSNSSSTSNSANSSSNSDSDNVSLVTLDDASQFGVQVKVPSNWTQKAITGGDYRGWTFTNPDNPLEQEKVVISSCVGCYTDSDGSIHPDRVIPQNDAKIDTNATTATSVSYTFTPPHSSVQSGFGRLIVSKDGGGYAYVEITTQNQPLHQSVSDFTFTS